MRTSGSESVIEQVCQTQASALQLQGDAVTSERLIVGVEEKILFWRGGAVEARQGAIGDVDGESVRLRDPGGNVIVDGADLLRT